jgi:glycerol kinase
MGTVESWIVWNLTQGKHHVTDHTNAAVTGLTVPTGTAWNQNVIDVLKLHTHQLPRIVDTMGYIGDATDLPGAPPIHAMVGDQQGSLVGQGCISPGMTKITFGTGGMLNVFTGERAPDSARRNEGGTFPIVAFSNNGALSYATEAIMLSAGTNIEWLRDDMGLISSSSESHDIASQCDSTEGVAYVPALLGLGTPFWDYGARGSIFGITRGTTRAHIVRAVLEGVAHRGVDLVDAAEKDSGLPITELRIDGGMSRNPTFVQSLANASGRPVRVSPITEATTLGAGFLAGTAAGQWSHLEEATNAISGATLVTPLGTPGISRQQWGEAVSRSRSWIPDLSALDF